MLMVYGMTDGVWTSKGTMVKANRVREGDQGYSLSRLIAANILAKLNHTDGTPKEGWEFYNWALPLEFTQ